MAVGKDPNTVSVGAGTLYVAPLGTAEPVSLTGAWDPAFIALGYTEKGTTFTNGLTAADVDVAEEYYPISTVVTAKTGKVDFALSQITAAALQIAYAGGTTTVLGTYVTFEPPLAGTETRIMIGWQSVSGDERYLWRRCFQSGATATARQKILPQALLPVSFNLEKPAGKLPWIWFGSLARTGA
jgi:hypothetical protein